MNITIREANIDDLEDVQNLNLKLFEKEQKEYDPTLNLEWTFGESGTKYYTERIKEDDGFVWVAEVDGKIVGYLCGGLKKEAYRIIKSSELENMMVLDEYRFKGIGKQLVDAFFRWSKSQGVQKIIVSASSENSLAIKFYRKNNFKDAGLTLEAELN